MKVHKIIGGIGFTLLILGSAMFDSEKLILPVVLVIVGMMLLVFTACMDESEHL